MMLETFKNDNGNLLTLTEETYPVRRARICEVLIPKKAKNLFACIEPLLVGNHVAQCAL